MVSLKRSCDFRQVYKKNVFKVNREFVILIIKNGLEYNRLGISVSKKVGNSVVRHRITRVVKEVFRLNSDKICPGYDIVVVARKAATDSSYNSFMVSIFKLLKAHHILEMEQD